MDRPAPVRSGRIVVTAAVLLFTGWHWARLEQPHISALGLLLLCVLAAAPPLVSLLGRPRVAWLAGMPLATAAAVGVVTATWPWQTGHPFYPVRVVDMAVTGLRQWFGTHTPIDAGRFPGADHDLQLAFFVAAALLTWLVVCRGMALAGIGIAFALFALPSTVLSLHATGFRAGLFLILVLLMLVATSDRTEGWLAGDGQVMGLGAAVVVAGLILSTAPGVTKHAFLSWQTWNPLARTAKPVSVDYMWNQTYGPLHWPKKRTQVLEVTSKTPMYWKAATLNTFTVDHWQLQGGAPPVATGTGGTVAVPAGQLPVEESVGHHQVLVKVKALALADNHLIGAAQPVRWGLPSGVRSVLEADGTVTTFPDVRRNATYSLLTYDSPATPVNLVGAGDAFPPDIRAGIVVGNATIPAWPAHRPAGLRPLSPAFMQASQQTWLSSNAASARNEYEAVVAVESYFRHKPFTYDLTPHYRRGVPALADFMLRSHRGYCQQFSGAMALVLRMHGIPARVADGFLPGRHTSSDTYLVNDRDAHSWVEVYFPDYGWLPFEPTPGDHLPSAASTSDPSFGQIRTGAQQPLPPGVRKVLGQTGSLTGKAAILAKRGESALGAFVHGSGRDPGLSSGGGSHTGFFSWLFTAAALLVAAVLAVKAASVRWRYLRRGPRAQATAAYRELATFVGDQGVEVRPEQTFEELAGRVGETFGVDASAFAESATRARYAPPALAAGEERRMRRELRTIKRDVRSRLTWRERAIGALRLRSALSQGTLGG